MFTVGLDWAHDEHALCVVNEHGTPVFEKMIPHTAAGLQQMLRALARLASPEQMRVAIERPSGLVVDTLVQAGHPVVPIHPNYLKASRARYSAAGAKSDAQDAYILADLLRTDGHRFRALEPMDDSLRALRALVRSRDDLLHLRGILTNQLTATLESFWPAPVKLFSSLHASIALDFMEKYPTPSKAKSLGPVRMAKFLKQHAYPGRRSPEEFLAQIQAAPSVQVGPEEQAAKQQLVQAWVQQLRCLLAKLKELSEKIETSVSERSDGQVLMSFPFAGRINAAQILVELGSDPARYSTPSQLAAEAGVAPVTYASGRRRVVQFRFACNKRLRKAVTQWANNSRRESMWAQTLYDQARVRGCRHPHAVRILARAWIRVLWRAWNDARPYDPKRHRAAAQLQAV